MSIILDGAGSVADEAGVKVQCFKGHWYFTKEPKQNLVFSYRRVSDTVSRDLLNYVSFVNLNKPIKSKGSVGTAGAEGAEGAEGVAVAQGAEGGEVAGEEGTSSASAATDMAAEAELPTGPVQLKTDHPLFGLWEGSFDVIKVPPSTEGEISETFFLHSFLGGPVQPELYDLPQEAHFSYSVLKASTIPLLPLPLATATATAKEEAKDEAPEGGGAAGPAAEPAVLVGFGRNQFGRFSLTASYHASSGKLICEKRYMLTKSASSKRGKKPEGDDVLSRPMLTRPRVNSNMEDGEYAGIVGPKRRLEKGSGGGGHGRHKKSAGGGLGLQQYEGLLQYEAFPSGAGGIAGGGVETSDNDDYKSAFYDETTGEVYEGGWYFGKRHGRGLCLFIDGTMYEGMWHMGKEQGRGQLLSGDRQVICVGDWFDGLMHGHGMYHFASGDRYTGEFREGNRHGKGEMQMRNGCRYVGDWKDNKRSGRGEFTWPDGSYYEGEWENDCRHGKGILELKGGFRYDGYWANNHLDGRGTCTFQSGQEYQGSYKAGLREGRGSIKFPEGAVYEGRFRDDRIDGQGTIKVLETVAGLEEGERMIPIEIQADLKRIHLKAGFGGADAHGHGH